jgi:hypothetical protein
VHFWPADQKAPAKLSSTARPRSASAITTTGLWPPSSSWTRLPSGVTSSRTCLPTGTEPVNEIASTCGWRTSGVPTAEPRPMTMLKTPGGMSASSRQAARCKPVSGASCASFITTVLP